jgi:IS5 family transposase
LSLALYEACFDVPLCREFAGLGGMIRLQDRVSILRFRRMLEENRLAEQFLQVVSARLAQSGLTLKEVTKVDATLIAAHYPTKNQGAERNPAVLREGT